jgi:hypothetical protein
MAPFRFPHPRTRSTPPSTCTSAHNQCYASTQQHSRTNPTPHNSPFRSPIALHSYHPNPTHGSTSPGWSRQSTPRQFSRCVLGHRPDGGAKQRRHAPRALVVASFLNREGHQPFSSASKLWPNPRLPHLRQLPSTTATALRRHVADSPSRKTARRSLRSDRRGTLPRVHRNGILFRRLTHTVLGVILQFEDRRRKDWRRCL